MADPRAPFESFPRAGRLCRRSDYRRVYETGRKVYGKALVLFAARNGLRESRLGITVTRRVGKANVRNLMKRRVREAYRRQEKPADARPGLDIVVNIREGVAAVPFGALREELARLLAKISGARP